MTAARDALRRAEGLPTLPTSVARLGSLLNDERAGAKEFEDVIRPDPALTSNLLRLANSPYFGVRKEVVSVRQAVALDLGSDQLGYQVILWRFAAFSDLL